MQQILLVDDEPYVVDDLSISIPWSDLQFEQVHLAYSGMEALEILQQHPIDIVITDINMPEMSGLQLIETIRRRWKHVKIVLLTGYAEFEYAKLAIEQQASAYLLKPISNTQLVEVIEQLQLEINREWENWSSYHRTLQTFREHLPLLRDRLLNDLLQGRRISPSQLAEQMDKFSLPFTLEAPGAILVARLEDFFQQHDLNSMMLFEYAIVNIANELFQEQFSIWSCKDVHDYLVFILQPKVPLSAGESHDVHKQLVQTAYQLQKNVGTIIGGGISVVTTGWGIFPDSVHGLYQSAVSMIRQHIGNETGLFLDGSESTVFPEIQTLQSLYEPPTLFHLFDTNHWKGIEEKILTIITELKKRNEHSPEHIQEAKHYLESAFYYFAHKNNKLLGDIIGNPLLEGKLLHTPDMLQEWALEVLHRLEEHFDTERKDIRSVLIRNIHDYIDRNLNYVSLQAIADHVMLHPVYLSKIYKLETGKRISDHISGVKMEKASYLLMHTPLKIYEISSALGYSNAQYFIKLFKEYSHMTPQEFRDRSN
ncbi:response regulator [Paenibacillus wynnii]|uniref:response regulator n=1 Tax=Paenibacillus wynnii TaxID=268407 RepID=UPI00278F216B|nr:response regulator [Paenibacillus wynnii]MDQ0192002.1 two-component system response regulator YesN [Paenibacillus wynnii]